MITIDSDDIALQLPGYLLHLKAGETVLIIQGDQPIAELKSLRAVSPTQELRSFGLCAGEFVVPDDFDSALPDAVIAEFEGA